MPFSANNELMPYVENKREGERGDALTALTASVPKKQNNRTHAADEHAAKRRTTKYASQSQFVETISFPIELSAYLYYTPRIPYCASSRLGLGRAKGTW
jgi:hypothetical protein